MQDQQPMGPRPQQPAPPPASPRDEDQGRPPQPQQEDEMLELLKRGEVRTMAKDIAGLREDQARREREQLLQSASRTTVPAQGAQQGQKPLMPSEQDRTLPLPAKPSRFSRQLPRIAIFLVLAATLIGGGAWYYLSLPQEPAGPPPPPPAKKQEPTPPPPPPSPQIPQALFEPEASLTLEVTAQTPVLSVLEQVLVRETPKGFTRIVLVDKAENTVLTLGQFFAALNVEDPQGVAVLLEEDFTLFLYESPAGFRRFGFAAKIKEDQGIHSQLSLWEPAMEKDFSLLMSLLGEKNRFYVNFFRTFGYQEVPIRYQTFSDQDLGLIYATAGNSFVFTTSLASMQGAIEKLTPTPSR